MGRLAGILIYIYIDGFFWQGKERCTCHVYFQKRELGMKEEICIEHHFAAINYANVNSTCVLKKSSKAFLSKY
jgi:hypothetical protein